jgi:geranylgeranyl pyrophosphate synthase
MASEPNRLDIFRDTIEKYGRNAMEKAIVEILNQNYGATTISSALKIHANFLRHVSPIFPALTALTCEAAGGEVKKTTNIGAALTLFVEAANLHDDIIDQTLTKYGIKTVFGRFGRDITLLAGDMLLVQGSMLLHRECDKLQDKQKKSILDLTFAALIEISNSVTIETEMRKRIDIKPEDYSKVIRLRAAVPEAHCRIGGVLGEGSKEIIDALGHYGRIYGIVGTVVDDFMDLLDYRKFKNRLRNECLPLPVLSALGDRGIKKETKSLLNKSGVAKRDTDNLVRLVLQNNEVKKLKKDTIQLAEAELEQVKKVIGNNGAKLINLHLLIEILKEILLNVG